MSEASPIIWNEKIKLAVSDVDETIAEVYTPAEDEMIGELSSYLSEGRKLFMVTGGSLSRVKAGITDLISPELRRDILISHCSGAEVWGFTDSGEVRAQPFYSVYEETFTPEMKQSWRDCVAKLVKEFELRTYPARPKVKFWNEIGREPLDVMLDDRGPQITLEVVNGTDLTDDQLAALPYEVPLTHSKHDLRTPLQERAIELFNEAGVPITPRFGGNFALDFAIKGVSKTSSIRSVLDRPEVLGTIGLSIEDLQQPSDFEIWGDKFSVLHGGTDRHMCEALPPEVRAIDFREEDPSEFLEGYNIVVWQGKRHLHDGLLEYLQSRNR